MKKNLLIFFALCGLSCYAQHEFWGTKTGSRSFSASYPSDYGTLMKTNFDGSNTTVMHTFDSIQGMLPWGRLFLSADDKIYGISSGGHIASTSMYDQGDGVLYEYDLITNRYRVVTYFGTGTASNLSWPVSGLISDTSGNLYGNTNMGIYKHNISSGVTSRMAVPPNFTSQLLTIQNEMNGGLIKASDGFLYGTTKYYSACPQGMPLMGSIIRVNPANNAFSYIHPFDCINGQGRFAGGYLIEPVPRKLYGTTYFGGSYLGPEGVAPGGSGILFEYDITTNTMTKKFDFNYATTGSGPGPLVQGDNGKLYGVLEGNGSNPQNPSQEVKGALFEYDMNTGAVNILHYFVYTNYAYDLGCYPSGTLIKGNDGMFYGRTDRSIFKFDPLTNAVTRVAYSQYTSDLLEICRKPTYQYFETSQYSVCAGSPFTFNLHNDNATTYVWKKGNQVMTTQTTGILHFDAITVADSGTYICEMTNECGTTVVPGISITVNPPTSSTVTSSIPITSDTVTICPGSSVVLSGNNNSGTWSTGATTPTITVNQAGDYTIMNSNSCGNTYSNTVHIMFYDIPEPIVIAYDHSLPYCVGSSITFTGNTAGATWPDGSTGATYTTILQANTDYKVVLQHPCGAITSNIIRFRPQDFFEDPLPIIIPRGPLSICNGSGVALDSNRPPSGQQYNTWTWYMIEPFLNYISNDASVVINQPGTYVLERTSNCFEPYRSAPVVITESTGPPETPIITPSSNILCSGSEIVLTSSIAEGYIWSTGATTQSIIINDEQGYYVQAVNGCGTATSNTVAFASLPVPDATITTINGGNTLSVPILNSYTYQWLECSIAAIPPVEIPGATGATFTPEHDGLYAVRITNGYGCIATSECFSFTTMGINEVFKNSIRLYPNPANEKVFLQSTTDIHRIEIINMLGQIVFKDGNTKEASIGSLSQGHYILIAYTGEGIWHGKFVKN